MGRSWLFAWGLAAVAFGGASLVVPGALVFGNLADKTGKRRPFVLAALTVATVTTLVIPTLESVPLVIARLNEYQGIGWAAGLGFVVTAAVSLRYDPVTAQRAFLFVCAASAAAGLVLAARALPPDSGTAWEPSPARLRSRVRDAARFNVRGAAFPFTPARFDPRGLRPRALVDRFSPALATYFVAILVVFTGFGVFFAPLPAYLAGVVVGAGIVVALARRSGQRSERGYGSGGEAQR